MSDSEIFTLGLAGTSGWMVCCYLATMIMRQRQIARHPTEACPGNRGEYCRHNNCCHECSSLEWGVWFGPIVLVFQMIGLVFRGLAWLAETHRNAILAVAERMPREAPNDISAPLTFEPISCHRTNDLHSGHWHGEHADEWCNGVVDFSSILGEWNPTPDKTLPPKWNDKANRFQQVKVIR